MAGFWDALTGQTNLSANDYNYDPSNKSLSEFERLKDPRFALPFFQKLAANAQPSRNTLLQTQKAMGGSAGTANAVANAQGSQAGEQALNQYGKSMVDLQGVAQGYLGQHLDKEAFIKSGLAQQEYANAANQSGFLDSLIGGGVSAGLNYFTGGASGLLEGATDSTMNSNMGEIRKAGNQPLPKINTPMTVPSFMDANNRLGMMDLPNAGWNSNYGNQQPYWQQFKSSGYRGY